MQRKHTHAPKRTRTDAIESEIQPSHSLFVLPTNPTVYLLLSIKQPRSLMRYATSGGKASSLGQENDKL